MVYIINIYIDVCVLFLVWFSLGKDAHIKMNKLTRAYSYYYLESTHLGAILCVLICLQCKLTIILS